MDVLISIIDNKIQDRGITILVNMMKQNYLSLLNSLYLNSMERSWTVRNRNEGYKQRNSVLVVLFYGVFAAYWYDSLYWWYSWNGNRYGQLENKMNIQKQELLRSIHHVENDENKKRKIAIMINDDKGLLMFFNVRVIGIKKPFEGIKCTTSNGRDSIILNCESEEKSPFIADSAFRLIPEDQQHSSNIYSMTCLLDNKLVELYGPTPT